MIAFDAAHKAVHYPPDRRFGILDQAVVPLAALCLVLLPLAVAWGQAAIFGFPYLPPVPEFQAATFSQVHGFPYFDLLPNI